MASIQRLHLLPVLVLISSLFAGSPSAATLSEGKDFSYRVEQSSLVAWKDKDYPDGLFGQQVKVEGEGIVNPGTVRQGVHVGPFPFRDKGEPSWLDAIDYEVDWKPSDTPHVMELTIRGRNKTKRRISFREHPLVVWVGPLGDPGSGRYSIAYLKGFDGQSITSLSADEAPSEQTRWIASTDRYRATVLERIEGPGTFRIETLPAVSIPTKPDEKPQAFSTNILVYQPLSELQIEEEFLVRMKVFTGLKLEKNLRSAQYLGLFDTWSGMTGWLSYLVFLLLGWFFEMTQSWGVSIILMTVFIKICLHPLSRKQLESMAKMQELQPRMQAIQTRYQDNPQRMQAEVQKLWVEAGVNPLSGCLPLIMQLPIFIALYNCLSYVPELRGVEFMWLQDLSQPDPLWVLPFLFSLGIYLSSMQSATDPSQKTMMQVMPLIMFWFMIGIPSGVMIYLAGQTLMSFVEQRLNKDLRDKMKKPSADSPDGAGAEAGDAAPAERVIDNDDAGEVRKKATGNKYKQARKNRKK